MHGISIVLKFKAIKSFDLFKKMFTLPRGSIHPIHPIHLKHHGAATSVRYGIIIKFSFSVSSAEAAQEGASS